MATPNRNKNEDGPKGSPKRGQGDGQEQNQPKTEEERIPNNREVNDSLQRGPPATGVNIKQQDYLLKLMMLIAISAIQNEDWLQRLQQENRNHQQRVRKENREQLRRLTQENRNHRQRVQEENQEQLKRLKQENRNHRQRVQKENQEQLQQLTQESRNHQQRVQEENQEQLQRLKQENRNHLQRVQEENQEQLQRVKQENRNHHLQMQSKKTKPAKPNAPGFFCNGATSETGDICCMCRKCKCHCHIHDKSTHGNVKDEHKLAGTMRRDTGHHRTVPRDKDSDVPKGESNGSTKKTDQYPNDGMSVACGGNPGDPSDSDGSDSEDDSKKDHAKDDRDENDQNRNRNKEKNISDWRIDTEVWKICIDMKDVQEANRLLNERILPDQTLLDRGSEVFGMSSKIVQNICTAICCYMKESFLHVIHVCPALDYRHEFSNTQITFVIYRTRPHENETTEYRYYRYYIRHVNEISTTCSEENTHIRELEQDFPKDYSKTEEIVECLNKNSKSLMEQHTNLTRVSISWFKSKGFRTKHQDITQNTCIALYVQVKGFVPLNETALPEVIDGIDVDVRECVVLPYTFPNEHHEHIKMGCAIHGGLRNAEGQVLGGTLGGFFEVDREMYCLTSAHPFMSPADMGKLKQFGKFCNLGLGNDIETFEAHQPVVEGSRSFGTGVRAVYKEGGNGETGVEAVVVKVQDRFPVSGDFPACPYHRNPGIDRPKFSTGKICNREEVNRLIRSKTLTVVKFGCSSGWTRGRFRFSAGAARLSNMVASIHSFGILLHNQFEIENIGETEFAEFGDSGALVFTDENNELSVIGIVEGGTPGLIYVTPICDVFSALELQNVQSTKEFTLHYQDIQNIPMDVTPDSYSSRTITDRSDSGISTNDEAILKHIEEKFQTFDQEITQEVARQVHKIKENMNTTVNQELSPVKSELSTLKSEVTLLKSEIQSKMQEQFTAQTNSIKNMLSEFFRSNPAANASDTNNST
ncbi:uncharacterized protein LOC123560069 isoform X2 [Mercenaria mercenaria]|uniref:uncharacterized protein LOC123560069 isoform X2 n=1 Tax=Mercenaria mercenaria TaxID=6596 RepID=UPI00234EB96E|nr:uncharacterized protein LOC123560069 isoform X2 [Mercenaria mercenaria]